MIIVLKQNAPDAQVHEFCRELEGMGLQINDSKGSDTHILGLIGDGHLLATMAQNPDIMGYEGVKAAVAAIGGESLGGAVTDTGVSVLTKESL